MEEVFGYIKWLFVFTNSAFAVSGMSRSHGGVTLLGVVMRALNSL